MPKYRRLCIPGGTYFFTICLATEGDTALVDHIDLLRAAFAATLARRPVRIDAAVVLPDHLHMIWTLPEGDAEYPTRISQIKARFTHALGLTGLREPSHARKGGRAVWLRHYWERQVRGPADLARHLAYCWQDPVRHRLVRYPGEWGHSSFHRDLRRGAVPEGWQDAPLTGEYGERAPALVNVTAAE